MTLTGQIIETIKLPDGVKATLRGSAITIQAGKGKLSRVFLAPRVQVKMGSGEVTFASEYPRKREKALVRTFAAHLRNMVAGVTEGHSYRMKIVFSHFPMKVTVKEQDVWIENFLGERFPRKAPVVGQCKVEVKGDEVFVAGPDIEEVGQTAANIERATKVKGFDPRVFQDGIYIVQKGG